MFLILLLLLISLSNVNCEKLNIKQLILNIRSPEEIFLFNNGSIIKSENSTVIKLTNDFSKYYILVSPVKFLKLKILGNKKFATTFSDYNLEKGNYLLICLEPKISENNFSWQITQEQIDHEGFANKLESMLIILAEPKFLEIHDNIKNKVPNKTASLFLPTFHFSAKPEFRQSAKENSLAIVDLRQFHGSCKEKILVQDSLKITI
jgi:hypothetical protein